MMATNEVRSQDELAIGNRESLFKLTLFGMRGDTFISLSILDQILSANFFIKNLQTFWEVETGIIWVNLTRCNAH